MRERKYYEKYGQEPAPAGGAAKRRLKIAAATVAVIAAIMAAWVALVGHGTVVSVWLGAVQGMAVYAVATAALLGMVFLLNKKSYERPGFGLADVILGGIIVVGIVVTPFVVAWQLGERYNVASIEPAEGMPTFETRAPYPVALEKIQRNTGGLTGELVDVSYVANHPDGPRWTGLVAGSGFVGAQGVVEWDPQTGTFNTCEFDPGASSPGGIFGKSLRRKIRNAYPRARKLDSADIYATCADGNATVYWPFSVLVGFGTPYHAPGGIAVMDTNGNITIDHDGAEPGDYPGPVVPISIVAKAIDSNLHNVGWATATFAKRDFYVPAGRVAAGEEDKADVNTGNGREFMLATTDGALRYVTPLSVVGSDPSTAAVAVAEADRFTPGQLPTVVIHELDKAMPSSAEVDQQVRAQFPEMGWAAGLRVMEVTPLSATAQVATLGFDLETVAVVIIDGDTITIDNGTTAAPGETNTETTPEGGSVDEFNVSGLSDAQLAQLLDDIAKEMLLRSSSS